jgi:hypothetical protein
MKSVSLNVGQTVTLNVTLQIDQARIVGDPIFQGPPLVNNSNSVIDGLIMPLEVRSLPLNGRNFLELALLIPGNSPAPNFDPTKTNTVVISSAGQLGRGGNVTIDGADTNDDVVGGSIQNISQEAIREFQIATNRFSSQLGRSGSSVINVITKPAQTICTAPVRSTSATAACKACRRRSIAVSINRRRSTGSSMRSRSAGPSGEITRGSSAHLKTATRMVWCSSEHEILRHVRSGAALPIHLSTTS